MENFKKDIKVLRPWFLLVTYFVALIFLIINFYSISITIKKFLLLLKPFFIGIAIAFVLNIPMKVIEKFIKSKFNEKSILNKFSRSISMLLTITLAFAILLFVGYIIIPQLISTLVNLLNDFANIVNGIINNTDQILAFFKLDSIQADINSETVNEFFNSLGLDWSNIIKSLTSMVGNTGLSLVSYVSNFTLAAANLFLAFMLSLYLLADKEKFIRQTKKLIIALFDDSTTETIFKYSKISFDIFNNFISGQLLEALVIGGLIYIALLIFKMPYSLLIASITAIMALVPILGATFACIIGFFLVLSVNLVQAFWFIVLYQVVQQFENNFIYPKVVGESVGLPGIWTLLSIVVFGGMFGVLGMLLAVPITAIMYTTGSELVNKKLLKKDKTITSN